MARGSGPGGVSAPLLQVKCRPHPSCASDTGPSWLFCCLAKAMLLPRRPVGRAPPPPRRQSLARALQLQPLPHPVFPVIYYRDVNSTSVIYPTIEQLIDNVPEQTVQLEPDPTLPIPQTDERSVIGVTAIGQDNDVAEPVFSPSINTRPSGPPLVAAIGG